MGSSEREGITHGKGEMGVILEEDGDGLTEVVQFERTDVVAADKDLSFLRVVQSCNEFEDCTLSRTVGTNDNLDRKVSYMPMRCVLGQRSTTHAKLSLYELERNIL